MSLANLISIKEFAKQLGKPESTVRTWKRRGDIPKQCFLSIAGSVFINVSVFEEWVKKGIVNDSLS